MCRAVPGPYLVWELCPYFHLSLLHWSLLPCQASPPAREQAPGFWAILVAKGTVLSCGSALLLLSKGSLLLLREPGYQPERAGRRGGRGQGSKLGELTMPAESRRAGMCRQTVRQTDTWAEEPDIPSSSGTRVIAVLSRPLPRLTRWGLSVCTFSPLPVSIRSKGPFCRQGGWEVSSSETPSQHLPLGHTPSCTSPALTLSKGLRW